MSQVSGSVTTTGNADTLDTLDSAAFAILAGQAGGQVLNGGTDSGDGLTLASTTHATKGDIIFQAGATRLASILASGGAIIGSPTALAATNVSGTVFSPQFQILATAAAASALLFRYSANSNGSRIAFLKTRGTSSTDYTATQAGDALGDFNWAGANGTAAIDAARMRAEGVATPGAGDTYCGASLAFSTSPGGTTALAERLFISNLGNIGINTRTFGTDAQKVVALFTGIAPSTSPTDAVQVYSADLAAGDAALQVRSETGALHKFGSYTVVPGSIRPAADGTTALTLCKVNGTAIATIDTTNSRLVMAEGANIQVGTTTGTKIGIGATAKLGFYGATPIVQRTHVADPAGGATTDAEARTAINAILATLEAYGFHAAS